MHLSFEMLYAAAQIQQQQQQAECPACCKTNQSTEMINH